MNLSYSIPHAEKNIKAGIKIHTLRTDRTGRWREGMQIHHCYSFRSKGGYRCFHKNECTGVQKVLLVLTHNKFLTINVNRKNITQDEGYEFIKNDGFDSMEDFIDWFFPLNKKGVRPVTMWTGKVIHWTNKRY